MKKLLNHSVLIVPLCKIESQNTKREGLGERKSYATDRHRDLPYLCG